MKCNAHWLSKNIYLSTVETCLILNPAKVSKILYAPVEASSLDCSTLSLLEYAPVDASLLAKYATIEAPLLATIETSPLATVEATLPFLGKKQLQSKIIAL